MTSAPAAFRSFRAAALWMRTPVVSMTSSADSWIASRSSFDSRSYGLRIRNRSENSDVVPHS